MGTLATVLAGKKIRTSSDLYRAEVKGDIEEADGVLKITRIDVDYRLKAPEGKKQDAEDAFEDYIRYCPGAQSVIGCIDIQHKLNFEAA